MEEENFNAKLAKLAHEIEQLDAKIDDKVSSLEERLVKEIWHICLEERKNMSLAYINNFIEVFAVQAGREDLLKTCSRVYKEVTDLAREYSKQLHGALTSDAQNTVQKYTGDVNRITRSAGLGEIWRLLEE
ncbi:hypothetical protein M1N57_00825 [Dehalococcoidales bacterium]|nr:hypothetical protein [Dehalococcoidales bacterium]